MHKINILIFCLLVTISGITTAQKSRDEKLEQLKNREDIKVTEIDTDLLRIEYPSGKILIKNIADYKPPTTNNQLTFSPNYDSTIIDLRTIDTTLYYQKYSFWQEVPIHNWDFDYLRIGDVNNNGKPELYGSRKFFNSPFEPITVYELNDVGGFDSIYQYDSVFLAQSIFDIDLDRNEEVLLTLPPLYDTVGNQQRFFSKENDSSLATQLNFTLTYFGDQFDDITLGDFDNDQKTDLIFDRSGWTDIHIFEYNSSTNRFDSVYRFDINEQPPWGKGGFSISDFDLDGKTDIVFSTGRGNVFVIENEGDNQYTNSWQGTVESNNAYIHSWTNDIDKNGKPEFWVLADAFYNGIGTTRITIFETNGNNSYEAVGGVDLVGIFSFYAGTMQAIDIDNDGTEELAVCIDQNFLILKFNGSENHQIYELHYIKQNELATTEVGSNYYGAILYDFLNDGSNEILISMNHIVYQQNIYRHITKIYKPDSSTYVYSDDDLDLKSAALLHNYPNPFNPETNIKFNIIETDNVSIKVYNILGKEVTTLLEEKLSPGFYKINWEAKGSDGKMLPSGVYLIRMVTGNYTKTRKALLIK